MGSTELGDYSGLIRLEIGVEQTMLPSARPDTSVRIAHGCRALQLQLAAECWRQAASPVYVSGCT